MGGIGNLLWGNGVVSHRLMSFLVYSLPILVVAFAVLMGAQALTQAAQDAVSSKVLGWIAMGCLLLLVTDMILLLGALGIRELIKGQDRPENYEP